MEVIALNWLDKIPPSLLTQALTHASAGGHHHNERLEFLGDAVLELVISEWLYTKYNFSEGEMSKIRAAIIREKTLAQVARQLDLGNRLILGKGEELSGGRDRPSLLADALEAVLAALYLTVGLDGARGMILTEFAAHLHRAVSRDNFSDYKSRLQEQLQAQGITEIEYKVVQEQGPDHDKTFWVEVWVQGKPLASGSGKTKKQAEQQAARRVLANRL